MSSATLAARRDRALGAGAPLFYNTPLHIVRGEGVYLFDADGRRYLDMYNNVPCVGHANPDVVEAMARQQATLNVHSRYLHEGIVAFAERLAAPARARRSRASIFSCSGTEANEVALRMARLATGKTGIVCTNATYHGNSEAVGKLTRIGDGRNAAGDVRAIPFPEKLRPLVPGASEAELVRGLSRPPARRDPQPRGGRRGLRRADRVLDLRQRGIARRAARIHAARRRDRARRRRPGDRRRGPGRLLPHRPLVGLRRHRLHARHRRHRQADGQRPAAGGDRREPLAGRGLPRRHALFQHLRLEPAAGGGRHGGARRHRARRPARERRHGGRVPEVGARPSARRASPRSPTCAATACSSASRSPRPTPPGRPMRTGRSRSSIASRTRAS